MSTQETLSPLPHLCQQFGFDTPSRAQRLNLMGLIQADSRLLEEIQRTVIRPQCQLLLDRFYDYLLGFNELRHFLGNPEHVERLKITQLEYLQHFGLDFTEASYFEYRLRIGLAHERVGLPLHMYLAAYRYLQKLILDALPQAIPGDRLGFSHYRDSINKVVILDISLAIDAYTQIRVDLINASMQAIAQERDYLTSQLMHDSLTRTLSRRFILETLNKHLAQLSRQADRILGVALLDLDHFKLVNDTFGHLVGDKVLSEFSRVVSSRVREQDYFGRFGGEEFLLILAGTPVDEAFSVLDRIREATQLHQFTHNGKHIPLAVSIGFTMARPHEKVDDLIERADNALYRAKSSGRNQVVHA